MLFFATMADMARRRLSGANSQESRKRKYDDREDESKTEDGSTDFPCHFCSSVFVTQMSLDRHVLTFHDGEVEVKDEMYCESEEAEDQDEMYENYENSDIKEENDEDESGLLGNEDDYFYTSQDKSETDDFFESSELKPQVTLTTGRSTGYSFSTSPTNTSSHSLRSSLPDRSLKPKLSSDDISTVLAQVEEMTANSTSEFVTCPLCHKTFGRKELSIHIACEHGGAKFSCPYCGRNISRRDHLKRHIKNVHPEMCTETEIGPFPRNLNLCRASNAQKKLNTSPNGLQQRPASMGDVASQVLPISVVTPRITMDDEDDEEDDFEGEDLLQQDTTSRNSQDSHDSSMQITVEPDLPFHDFNDIDYSEEDYATPSFIMDVLQLQEQSKSAAVNGQINNGVGFSCTVCSATFSSKTLLDRHESTHDELRPHKCQVCAKGFLRKEHLSKHLSSVHSGMKFTCEFCGKDISRKDHLIRHIRNVHPTQFYSLPQEMEQEMVIQSPQLLPVSLKAAQSMQPKPKKPFFSCDMCEATFVNVDDLHAHQATVHSDVRKYKCGYCCKAFKRKEHLTKHEVLHTGERKFGCRVCGNEFLRKDALQEHIRRTHGVDGNSSTNLISTKSTVASSPNQPPPTIPCNLCDQKFRDRGMLLSHMTTVHGLIVNSPPGLPKNAQQQRVVAATTQANSKGANVLKNSNPKPDRTLFTVIDCFRSSLSGVASCVIIMAEPYQYEKWLSENLGVSFLKEGHKWDPESDVADVVERIKNCENLKYLELEGNTLGVSAAKAIAKALETKPEFEAALWKDLFTGRLKNEIPQAFNFLFAGVDLAGANLQRLDLSDNAIGPVGMVGLAPFFKTASSYSLKELILNNNGFGPEGGSSLAESLLQCLRQSKELGGQVFQLKVFVCGRNRLENKAAKRLAEFFKEVETLEEIHMPQNGIYKEGIAALSDGIRCNKNMQVLNLNDNTIRGDGITKLASAISDLKNLKDLSLSDCLLKGPGVLQIVNALKSCGSVTKVNFSGNELSKASGKQAAEALRSLSNLEEVNLSCNSLGTEGGEFVSNILQRVNVVIEDDDGTEEEDVPSDDDAAEVSNAYEDISSDEQEQAAAVDTKLKQSAIDTFLANTSEDNYVLLDKDSPYDVLKQYFSDVANQETSFGHHCVDTALKISAFLELENKSKNVVSDRLVNVFMDLMSDGLSDKNWTPNEFTTYFLIKAGVFRAECGTKSAVINLNNLTLYCLSKWLTERAVSRNVAFYLAVISRYFMREQIEQIGVGENSLLNFQKVSESAYNYSLKAGSGTTIPVQQTVN
ncbi:Ran GTPase-activating protein [Orchesella cincta]|uniref:Ran GTPase-activating protein n=1 Tax=Orchesella cincta TaxID=48709 RepID=A0A1D2NFK9_ORCCI|nr:Ran GTPase-activating protein [Orchesella cincta]